MSSIIERATNEVLRELNSTLADQLEIIDAEMHDEDEELAEVLGWRYGPTPTPPPVRWQIGQTVDFTQLTVDEYPVVACWGHDIIPQTNGDGDWGTANGRMLVQTTLIAEDTIFLARYLYRYVGAVQELLKNTTLNGLCDPVNTVPRIDISAPLQREHDDGSGKYWLQAGLVRLLIQYIEV